LLASEQFDTAFPVGEPAIKTEPTPTGAVVVTGPAPVVETEIALPPGMLTHPWRHQQAAYRYVLDHFASGLHGILLAMGMGTGKSLVACMLVLGLAARRVLIACPLRVVPVWISQFERHVGTPVVIAALDEDAGSVAKKQELAEEKMRLAQARGVPFVAVINFDGAWRDPFAAWAEKQQWDIVIADEAHRIKSPGGKASLFFKRLRLRSRYRIALSGTPMPHGPLDIYAVFRFLDITIFGPSFAAFRQTYAVMGGFQRKQITGFQNLDELERLMGRITFRVGKDVLDLPPETHVTYHCDLAGEGRRIYKDIEDDFVAQVRDNVVTAANALVKLLRLQQVANGIVKTDDGEEHRVDDAKKRLLADTLEDIGGDEPVVVFCRFHPDLDAVHEACESHGYTSLELSGRRDEVRRWQDGEAQVLAVQIQAGGVGVDLTRARYDIFYSLSFSLGDYDQAQSRVHRPGQTRPVEHIHLVARNTVDVRIMRALEKRAEIIESILAEITN
jgi:SNF2 family DNA or RNA helicase